MSFLLIFLLLIASVRVAKVKTRNSPQSHVVCNLDGFRLVEAKFGRETHWLCLKMKTFGSSPLANHHSAVFLNLGVEEDSSSEQDNYIQALPLGDFVMAHGYLLEDPSSGSAEGYIGGDQHFYGVLHIGNRTLYADPYGKDVPHKFFGAFENDNVPAPRHRRDQLAQANLPSLPKIEQHYLPFQIAEHGRRMGTARGRICDLLLLADKAFYEKDAMSSLEHVVRRMMHAVAQADIIFRNADFNENGTPDNIGFYVKYILVLTSDDTNTRVFGNLLNSRTIDGREYLMKFSKLRRLSEVCLGVAFSGHAFQNRTLGLSFTSLGGGLGGAAGGLCDRRAYGRSFNTLAIAHATTNDNSRVPERIAALTLAHELGHSFGAHHDDKFPNPECRGYLMGSQSSSPANRMSFEFSLCSKRLISTTLSSMSYCFTEETSPYCGNGIVEEGEACDCGLPLLCNQRDPCCTPRAGGAMFSSEGTLHKEGCSVAPTAMCHPSQGLCCKPNCKFADLMESGIDCKTQNLECACQNNTALCQCRLGGRCLPDGTCHAAECALLGLAECHCIISPGGSLAKQRMCGICCLLIRTHKRPKCVGAEQAAREVLQKTHLSTDWPGFDYVGPNVSITICSAGQCRLVQLRAWPPGSPCVTRGSVGVCSPRGVCTRTLDTPRSNVYPEIMHVRLQSAPSSSRILTACSALWFNIYICILIL